ncbi:MAG: hypothetical protein ACE5LV_00965 [Candidatus Aminicenantales bacterium]
MLQISFIYFSALAGERGITEWVSLWRENEVRSVSSGLEILPLSSWREETARFAIVYPDVKTFLPH